MNKTLIQTEEIKSKYRYYWNWMNTVFKRKVELELLERVRTQIEVCANTRNDVLKMIDIIKLDIKKQL